MVLENKLGITESAELAREEERISKTKALEPFEKGILNTLETGTFNSLSQIHKYLFDEIYHFAGKIRNVNLASPVCDFVFKRQVINVGFDDSIVPSNLET